MGFPGFFLFVKKVFSMMNATDLLHFLSGIICGSSDGQILFVPHNKEFNNIAENKMSSNQCEKNCIWN